MSVVIAKDWVVLVDAYSGGRYLIPAFQALGCPVLHVESADPPPVFRADNERARSLAEASLRFDGDLDRLVAALGPTPVCIVQPGSEGGVLLADQLADRLGVAFRNSLDHSAARRDKFAMQTRLRDAGLAHIASVRVRDRSELAAWLDSHGQYPIVVKPLQSAGSDGVSICHSAEDAETALERVRTVPDMFGNPNAAAICQEFLTGDEHVVNGVACSGSYWFSEGWRSTKADNHGYRVYDTQYLTGPGDEEFDRICPYVIEVCRALGIVNGAFHAEVMLTGRGPVLIEIAARVAGGSDPYVIETCFGHSQVNGLVNAMVHPERLIAGTPPGRPRRRAAYVYLIAEQAGRVKAAEPEAFLSVPGVILVDHHYAAGDLQPMTRDLLSAPGVVMVTAESNAALAESVRRIRVVERALFARTVLPENS